MEEIQTIMYMSWKVMRGPALPAPGGSQHPNGPAKIPPSYHAPHKYKKSAI